jgi:hypothetical protein
VSIYELTPRELFDTYIGDKDPAQVVEESRTDLATRLRVDEGLTQEEAYHAADQILAYAMDLIESEQARGRTPGL